MKENITNIYARITGMIQKWPRRTSPKPIYSTFKVLYDLALAYLSETTSLNTNHHLCFCSFLFEVLFPYYVSAF